MKKIKLLFLSWRDIKSPKKGGAEVFTHEMLKRVDKNKFEIIHFSPKYNDLKDEEFIDGIKYIRKGNILSVIYHAIKFYKENKDEINYVFDQCNTHRFFTKWWVEKEKRIFFIHQLTKDIWFKNMFFPLNYIGYYTEVPFLKLSKDDFTFTVSNSTKKDLLDIGFNKDRVKILPEGIDFKPWKKEQFHKKEKDPTYIYVGRFSNYKGIDDAVKAFVKIYVNNSNAKLWIVGKTDHKYVDRVLKPILDAKRITFGEDMNNSVVFHNFVSFERKLELMSRAHALVCPSLREGWGLIVTEAAAVGTPSIVYKSPGLVDAVNNGKAGYLVKQKSVEDLYEKMKIAFERRENYEDIRSRAYEFSKKFHWENTKNHFEKYMKSVL